MDIMRKYLLSSVCRSPDDPVADPVVADPAAVVDPVVADPVTDPVAADPVPPPKADPTPKWALERIGEETTRRHAAEETARVAVQRANSLEEITRRLQAKPVDPANPAPVVEPPVRTDTLDQAAVQREAARQIFERDARAVSSAGASTYGAKWDDALKILDNCGANSTEFVANVMDIDQAKAHEIMFALAQDGEKAFLLSKMTPTRRIAEITRMTMAQGAAADPKPAEPKPAISKAPAPKPVIAPHAAAPDVDPRTPDGNEKLDDKQWEAWVKRNGGVDGLMKRSA